MKRINRFNYTRILTFILFFTLFIGCSADLQESGSESVMPSPPEWSVNANIYEVNIRQFSGEGTFDAFTEEIPRLDDMGVKILWLMPIHPIGEKNRKGTLGSYYSIADYREVNPEFGTKADLKELVIKAHEHDMKVIIDWVANHTSWDAVWTESNPEYYMTDEDGNFYPPVEDWEDVIQLDVHHEGMQNDMIDAMEYWVREFDIDGFRADVAYMVPTEFWVEARKRLDEIKPVFMLAEAEEPELHRAFDMTYAWAYASTIRDIGAGESGLEALDDVLEENFNRFEKSDYRMLFTTNHDENSWQGSDTQLYGENFENFAVLSATVWGMPLIYNGQESGLNKQLEFFEKDRVEWEGFQFEDFYRTLLRANRENRALFNGEKGGDYQKLTTDSDEEIFSFQRKAGEDEIFVILNFADEDRTFTFEDGPQGEWTDLFNGSRVTIPAEMTLGANKYLLLER